ncbi:branched-chain amino acid ABC transporter ATP-binding protein/permease [Rhodococcus sp. USK13]|uniref:branched-chain amino acid ABC transporter ATP-binding protein/permease n=1 Tax=Rhodococcus sp. USK13 TaxID=2806442 RepID=UPI001BCD384B|nr:branched-chain amino acid ABC transporter ATP-binding protein/permease [Rhodococcus sp. USK13]
MDFFSNFGAYDFLVRDSLVLILVGASIYILFNAGFFAVPQIGFMAIGAYTSALVSMHLELPLFLSLICAILMGAAFGVLLGAGLARLNGVYLAIATVGFSEMVRVTIRNLEFAGGATGLVGVDRSLADLHLVVIVVVVFTILALVAKTRHGRAMTAIREDSLMAAHQGISTRMYRLALFTASGALAGLAGGMQVHITGFVEPSVFSFELLSDVLAATVVGGITVVAGPLVGGALMFGLAEGLRDLQEYRHLINGALIVLIVAFVPSGVYLLLKNGLLSLANMVGLVRKPEPIAVDKVSFADLAPADGVSEAQAATSRALRKPIDCEESILRVDNLVKTFGGVKAVRGVSLDVKPGEVLGIIGPNGSGKTTVLNLLSGVYVPDSGDGVLASHPFRRMWGRPNHIMRAGLSRTFQNIRLIDGASVAANVRIGAYVEASGDDLLSRLGLGRLRHGGQDHNASEEAVRHAMARVGIADIAGLDVASLPYGLKRKVEIARGLVARPEVLLLDEPTAGMTPTERDEIFDVVQSIRAEGTSVVVVEHDVGSMTRHCDRLVVLNFGQVLAFGPSEDVIKEEAVIDAYIGRAARA